MTTPAKVRVEVPASLCRLANISPVVQLEVSNPVTQSAILDALETLHPTLRGTLRDQTTKRRRPFIRFFACGEDLSHESPEAAVPDEVASGVEPFLIIGAIAGG